MLDLQTGQVKDTLGAFDGGVPLYKTKQQTKTKTRKQKATTKQVGVKSNVSPQIVVLLKLMELVSPQTIINLTAFIHRSSLD